MEGMEPDGSSREMRSTQVMGKKMVGRPMRSASNWLIWLTKWSKEFRSPPRKVTPLGLISSKRLQIFSRGECRLTITMELGFMGLVVLCLLQLTARGQKISDDNRSAFRVCHVAAASPTKRRNKSITLAFISILVPLRIRRSG